MSINSKYFAGKTLLVRITRYCFGVQYNCTLDGESTYYKNYLCHNRTGKPRREPI